MESSFDSCLAFTATEEGGYVDDPRDSGNWTSGRVGEGILIGSNRGVGAPALLDWLGPGVKLSAAEMRGLSLSTYEAIARSRYWTPLGCTDMPPGVDLMTFDFGWNRGIGTSLDLLTRCLAPETGPGVIQVNASISALIELLPATVLLARISFSGVELLQQKLGVSHDGIAGPQTLAAFEKRSDLRTIALVLALSTAQITSYRRLSNFSIYGAGWLARTARRQSAALMMTPQAIAAAKLEACL